MRIKVDNKFFIISRREMRRLFIKPKFIPAFLWQWWLKKYGKFLNK